LPPNFTFIAYRPPIGIKAGSGPYTRYPFTVWIIRIFLMPSVEEKLRRVSVKIKDACIGLPKPQGIVSGALYHHINIKSFPLGIQNESIIIFWLAIPEKWQHIAV